MKKFLKFVPLIAIILIIAAYIIYSVNVTRIRYNPEGTQGNTAGNILNGGLFAEHDGIIYFSNPYDGGSLYSMKSDCSDVKKLTSDSATYINVCDNYIFYARKNTSSSGVNAMFQSLSNGIVRISLNGKNTETLTTDTATQMVLYGNTIIYKTYEPGIFYQPIDGADSSRATALNFSLSGLADGIIYYSNDLSNHNVYAYDCSTKATTEFLAGNTYLATVSGGCLYYLDMNNDYALTKYNIITKETTVLYDGRCVNYNVYDTVVFYQTEGDEYALRRINTDGSNDTLIASGSVEHISCTSQYTFFNFYNQNMLYRVPTYDGTNVESIVIE